MLRFAEILYVFALHFVFYWLNPALKGKNVGERLNLAANRLGVVYKKIVQVLAARNFFDGSAQTEIEKAWDSTEPLPFVVIKPIVEQAIGEPIETYFDKHSFEETPHASASIAQTHVAVRHGKKKMVKVRRPGVIGKMRTDIRIARLLIGLGALFSKSIWCIKSAKVPEQVEAWLLQETDFLNEGQNVELFRAAYDTDFIVVPEVDFVSEDVLIEEFLEGIPCNKWHERYRAEGYDPQASVRNFLPPTFGPPFRGTPVPVHGDPHPANLIVMKGGRMGVVDYGRVGIVTKQDLTLLNNAVFAVYAGNAERTVEALLRLGNFTFKSEKRRRAFEKDVAIYVRECRLRPFDYWITEMSRIKMRHGVSTTDAFTLIGCFGVLANRVAQMFFPGSSTLDLVGEEIRAGMRQQMLERFTHVDLFPLIYELSLRAEQLPRDAASVVQHPLDKLAELSEAILGSLRPKAA